MKTYKELIFRGNESQLKLFINEIGKYATGNWKVVSKSDRWREYLFFDYVGDDADNSRVSIYIGNEEINKGELRVGNITPLVKDSLSIEEYNVVLVKFYNDIIKPYKENEQCIIISEPTTDIFDPLSRISKVALKKLTSFCGAANKSTGSSHPCDQERWFDFICQTVDDDQLFSYDELAEFLQDEDYWEKEVGCDAWNEEFAYKLASEYESMCQIVQYYKTKKGI